MRDVDLKVRLCTMAIRRHMLVCFTPLTWPLHEVMIVAVYGWETYQKAMVRYLKGE